MSLVHHGFHNINMYGFGGYNMFGGCCNPYAGMVAANLLYNPFMVFNTAAQLVNGNFPNFGAFSYPQFQYSYMMPSYNFSMSSFGNYQNFNNSLYNGWMSPYFSGWNLDVPVVPDFSVDPLSVYEQDKTYISDIFGLSITKKVSQSDNVAHGVSARADYSSVEVGSSKKVSASANSAEVEKPAKTKTYNYIHEQIAGSHLTKEFLNKTKEVARNIGCDYQDLLAVMNSESSLNPRSEHKNKYGKVTAVGLIQFTRDAAIPEMNKVYGLNLTVEKIKNMSAIEQLDLVQKYYEMNKRNMPSGKLSAADLYSVTFLPARASREVLCRKGEAGNSYYESNKGLDINADKKITKDDLEQRLAKKRVSLSTFA